MVTYQSPICILTFLSTMQHIPELICVFFQEEMFVDVGVYGVPKNERFDAERTTRKVEEFVR